MDLPPEEDHYINIYTKKYNVHNIRLLTPTTHKERLKKFSSTQVGFYIMSQLWALQEQKNHLLMKLENL